MTEGTAVFQVPGLAEPCHTWYKVVGDLNSGKTPLILLHGGPGACHEYLLPLTDLSVPLVFYDQIGNGKSTHLREKAGDESFWTVELFKDELDNLLRHLGLDSRPIDLYGQSWGGMLAAEWAIRHADSKNLRRLVLANSLASIAAWRVGLITLKKQLSERDQATIDKAEESGDFKNPEYEAVIETFYKKHLSLARPWPCPEVQAAIEWLETDNTTYNTM